MAALSAVLSVALTLACFAAPAAAQEDGRARLEAGQLDGTSVHRPRMLEGEWRVRAGDAPEWAARGLDDASWQRVPVALPDGGAHLRGPDGALPEVAWFRLHLSVDSSLHGMPVGLRTSRDAPGAAQLYLDGSLLFDGWRSGGRLPLAGEYEVVRLAAGEHVVAVRYSFADAPGPALTALPDGRAGGGVAVVAAPADGSDARLAWAAVSSAHFFFFVGALLAFGLLHLTLFLFFARPRSNLYFALFAVSWAVHTFVVFGLEFTTWPARYGMLRDVQMLVTLPVTYVTGLLTVHSLFYKRLPWHFWAGVALIVGGAFAAAWPPSAFPTLHPTLHLLVIVLATVVILEAMRRGKQGAGRVGLGFLVLLASVVVFDLLPTLGVLRPTLHFGSWYGSVALLVAMSVQLARTYALSSGGFELATRALVDANRTLERRVKERTSELGASETKFRSLIHNASDAILLFDAETLEIMDANPAAEELLGVDRVEMLGTPLPRFCAMEELDHCLCQLRDQVRSVATLHHDFTLRRRDGRRIPVELSASTVEVDGRPVVQGIMHDLTERVRAETALREAKEIAEAANATKSQFLANMSHELRTPLNAILGYSEMLREDAEAGGSARLASDLGKINAAGKHLLGLINTVLDISKVEAGRMDLHVTEFAVRLLALEVGATLRPLVEQRENMLSIEVAEYTGTMRADETKVRQILMNLVGNAAKFTERGSIRLAARREEAEGEPWIVFEVADTGIGMTPEQVGRLFQPFVQVDASIGHRYGGTGLGLALSKRFTELMNGSVSVSSEAGVGSSFTVRLPALVQDAPRAAPAPAPLDTPMPVAAG